MVKDSYNELEYGGTPPRFICLAVIPPGYQSEERAASPRPFRTCTTRAQGNGVGAREQIPALIEAKQSRWNQ